MKTIRLATAALIALLGIGIPTAEAQTTAQAPTLRAGTAKINITPENPTYPVHDSLWARSLILDVGGERIAFIAYDNTNYVNDDLLSRLKARHDLKELFFCQSHTHSGAWDASAARTESLFTQVLDQAASAMFDATISGGWRTFPQLSFMRLIVRDDGRAKESWEGDDHYRAVNPERIPHGPVDNSVGVIRIDDAATGSPRVVVMNYACHPDVVWNNFEVSADFVGYAAAYTEQAFDGAVTCLFVQGGAGNQAPLFKDGGRQSPDDPRPANYDLIERMGKLLGIEAVKLTRELYPNPYDVPSLRVLTSTVEIGPRWPTDDPSTISTDVAAILINDRYSIATFPGEPFIKFQFDWKREMSTAGKIPFFFGYTWNGGRPPGYVPDVRSAALGGFGTDRDIAIGTGEAIMTRLLKNFYHLQGLFTTEP